jgi:hypothetical protein
LRVAHRTAHYASILASALLAALAIGIMINALALQQSRHPAPLFAKSVALSAVPPAAEAIPLPTPRPTAALTPATAPAAAEKPALAHVDNPVAETTQASEPKAASGRGDLIAQLLKAPNGSVQPTNAPTEPSKTVAGAQRALMKLGFVIKPDGLIGTTTRQAIEHFERDRGLPVRGELTPKIVHELSAQSGITID